jgi:branched-chain amino acid transport system ATP-binding protein
MAGHAGGERGAAQREGGIAAALLAVDAIDTFYGTSQALFGLSLEVPECSVVALLGRNGMGKSTTVRSIMGLRPPRRGRIVFAGREVQGLPPFRIAQAGIGLVPEGRIVFPTLTVHENLVATARVPEATAEPWTAERVYALFPRLAERRTQPASTLSGGEQQMLAIGRALATNPRLLVLDEATEGLAPLIRREIWRCIGELRQLGLSILIIDKNLVELADHADRAYIVEKGRIAWQGAPGDVLRDAALKRRYLGV